MVVGALSRLEPGGWGAFLALARSPTNPMLWLAGADVGGLFVSRNDGRDWASCGRTLPTLWIMAIMFTEDGLPVVGTSAGVWCAVPTESSHSCGDWDLAPCNDGLRSSNASLALATSGFEFSHPVRALALDDTSIWAGVGIQKNLGPVHRLRNGDPYHVYKRPIDSGTWQPVLSLPSGGGQVMSLAGRRQTIYVATPTGLFGTRDDGRTWMELGVSDAKCSHDAGKSWTKCVSPPPFAVCSSHCLPLASSAGETRPNARKVVAVGNELWVTIWDAKAWPDAGGACKGTEHPDPDLKYFTGGPWYSADGGASWQYLFRSVNGSALFDQASLRCPGVSDEYAGSQLPQLAVDPADTSRFMLAGWARAQGLHEVRTRGGRVVSWNTCQRHAASPDAQNLPANELEYGCYEGRRPDSLANDHNTYAYDFRVQWATNETRTITNGTVVPHASPSSAPSLPHIPRPLAWITTSRGALRAAWDPVNQRYSFKHFNDDVVSLDSSPPRWRTTGLGDTCVWGGVWLDHTLLMAVADGGVARTEDEGATWQRPSESWPFRSQGTAITSIASTGCVFAAHHDRGGTNLASVLRTCDRGDSWDLIGGFQPPASASTNSLYSHSPLRVLIQVPSVSSDQHRQQLIAGGADGLYEYDSARPSGQQWRNVSLPSGSMCGVSYGAAASTSVAGLAAGITIVGCESGGLWERDTGGTWRAINLLGSPPSSVPDALSAVASWKHIAWDPPGRIQLVLGGRQHYVPSLWRADCWLGPGSSRTCNLTTSVLPINASSRTVQRMRVSAIVASGNTLIASFYAADYFDGYVPPGLLRSADGARSFVFEHGVLSNPNVVSLHPTGNGRVCAATNGDGYQCFSVE